MGEIGAVTVGQNILRFTYNFDYIVNGNLTLDIVAN